MLYANYMLTYGRVRGGRGEGERLGEGRVRGGRGEGERWERGGMRLKT